MSRRPAANPGLVWRFFGVASALVVVVSLAATVPSGDRTTIVLTLWCDLVAIVAIAAVTYAVVSPMPHEERLDAKEKYRGTWL